MKGKSTRLDRIEEELKPARKKAPLDDVRVEVRIVPASYNILDDVINAAREREKQPMNEVANIRRELDPVIKQGEDALAELRAIEKEGAPLLQKASAVSLREMDMAGLDRDLSGNLHRAVEQARGMYGIMRTLVKYTQEQPDEILRLDPVDAKRLAAECKHYITANLHAPANARDRLAHVEFALKRIADYMERVPLRPRQALKKEPPMTYAPQEFSA